MTNDPRGPIVQIVKVETPLMRFEATGNGDGPTLVTKSCGHTGEHSNHFHYRIGDEIRCFECRKG